MRKRLHTIALAILILALPLAALANVTGTPTLNDDMSLSLDTGTTSTTASSGDIYWNGTSMTPEGSATIYNFEQAGAVGYSATFAALTQSLLSELASAYTKTPVPASTLIVGDIFLVHTNGGNYSAVVVTGVSTLNSSLGLQFITFISTASGPVITEIENNYGEVPPGFANSGIAPGALFFIVGTGMATPGSVAVLQNPAVGLPNTLNGASVKVTSGGVTTTPAFYYAEPTALGLVMPSNTPLGTTAQVTVSYGGQTSQPFTINVVQNAFGIDAYYGAGTGLAIAVFTNGAPGSGCAQAGIACYVVSIPPGTQIELYGSGLGADPTRDTTTSYANLTPINALAHMYIGGVDAQITYQGPSGFPGLDQINVTVPTNAPTGCNVSLVGVSTTGVPTNFLSLPIGSGVCSELAYGITGSEISSLSGQTSVSTGVLGLGQVTTPATSGTGTTVNGAAFGNFEKVTGSSLGSSGSGQPSIPGCLVTQTPFTTGSVSTVTYLDAGVVTVTGPSGQAVNLTETSITGSVGFYGAQLPAGYIPTTGGTFTFKGAGGANIGPFTASVVFPDPVLLWTNQSAAATVTRTAGLPITWTGGASGTYVTMSGSSSSSVASGSFTCVALVSAGQFTVPAYVLAAMPAGSGTVTVGNGTNFQSFTASGLNYGITFGEVTYQVNSTYN